MCGRQEKSKTISHALKASDYYNAMRSKKNGNTFSSNWQSKWVGVNVLLLNNNNTKVQVNHYNFFLLMNSKNCILNLIFTVMEGAIGQKNYLCPPSDQIN